MPETLIGKVRTLATALGDPAARDRHRFYRVRRRFYDALWSAAATACGAELRDLGGSVKEISRGPWTTLVRRSDLMLDSALTQRLLADKAATLAILAAHGAPVPRHAVLAAGDLAGARRFLDTAPGPVVVKPAADTGAGRGVTTGIADDTALAAALRHAARHAPRVLVEDQQPGAAFRLTWLDGEFLQAVRRDPPRVEGDGKSTLRALMAAETRRRLEAAPVTALSPLDCDGDALACLAAQGLTPQDRPAAGETVTVKRVVNQNAAAENHLLPPGAVHPSIVALGDRLVAALGVGFAGLDILAPDLARPLEETGGTLGEINVNPGIHHHHLVADPGIAPPLAHLVLERLLSGGRGSVRRQP